MGDMDLARRFNHHAPRGNQVELYVDNRARFLDLAVHVAGLGPNSRELSLAITALEEALMWANAHIARNDVGVPDDDSDAG